MQEVTIASHDGVPIRVYHSLLSRERGNVIIVLPLATRPSFIKRAIDRLALQYNVFTWESRLILEPGVKMENANRLSLKSSSRDLDTIFDYFRISSASLLGYCSGAATALHLAAHNPTSISRLALVNGAYFLTSGECDLTQYEKDVLGLVPQVASGYDRASYLLQRFFRNGAADIRFGDAEFGDETCRPFRNADSLYRFGLGLKFLMEGNSQETARGIKLPSLIVYAKGDERTHFSSSVLIQAQLQHVESYVIQGGDHYEFCRANPELLDKIAAFLSRS